MTRDLDEIRARLSEVSDPVGFLADLFAHSPVAFQVYKGDGHCLLTNAAFRRLFGSEPPPEYNVLSDELAKAQGVLGLIHRAFAGETVELPPFWYDPRELTQVKVTEGKRVAISSAFFPIKNEAGKVTHVGIVFREHTAELQAREAMDTALRQAEEARAELQVERQRLNAVLEQLPSALAIVSAPGGDLLMANDRHRDVFLTDPSAPVNVYANERPIPAFKPGGVRYTREELPVIRALNKGEVVRGEELEVVRPDGSHRFVRLNAGPVRDAQGKIVAGVVTSEDVTEERYAREQAAFLSEASKLLASSLDFETTLKTVVKLAVPKLADWCALELKQPDGTSRQLAVAHVDPAKVDLVGVLRARYPTSPDSKTGIYNILRTGKPEITPEIPDALLVAAAKDPDHLRILRSLGMQSAMAVPVFAHQGVIGVLALVGAESGHRFSQKDLPFAEELASRMGLAIANATLYKEAQDAVRLRDDFLSVASHELKTPLTSLELTISNLRRLVDQGKTAALEPQALAERLTKVSRQTGRLTTLINQLLDISRIAAGKLALDRAQLDLAELTTEVVARFREEAERSGTALSLRIDGPVTGNWDRDRLDQVVTNLVSNALKYGAGKAVEVGVGNAEGESVLSVRDHGIGIDLEHQARIFDRFERAVSSRNYGGLGLGLWITRQIVDAHGGHVEVTSTLGDGATFKVALPKG